MEFIRGGHNIRDRHHGCVATIGNFDGVHRGHRAVIDALGEAGRRLARPTTLITFEPHPREFFAPARAPARLTRLRDKLAALSDLDVERVVCLGFGRRLASMSPEAFVRELLIERLGIEFLMVGDDFRFGHKRAGDFALLAEAATTYGFELTRMPTVVDDGERISSTRVRNALAAGDLATAQRLLGRPFRLAGRVVCGDAVGRQLGWRTANIRFHRTRPPVKGVFAVRVSAEGLNDHPGVASVGTRPTVNGRETLLETHLFDFEGDLYGRHLNVAFVDRIRDEERFDSLEALRDQIARDADNARARLAGRPGPNRSVD